MKKFFIAGIISIVTAAPIASVLYFKFSNNSHAIHSLEQSNNGEKVHEEPKVQNTISESSSKVDETNNQEIVTNDDSSLTIPALVLMPSKPRELTLEEKKIKAQVFADQLNINLKNLLNSEDYKYFLPESFKNINKIRDTINILLANSNMDLQNIEANNENGEVVFSFNCLETLQEFHMKYVVKTISEVTEYLYQLNLSEHNEGYGNLKISHIYYTYFNKCTNHDNKGDLQILKDDFCSSLNVQPLLQEHIVSITINKSAYNNLNNGYYDYVPHYVGGSFMDIKHVRVAYNINWFGVLLRQIAGDWYQD